MRGSGSHSMDGLVRVGVDDLHALARAVLDPTRTIALIGLSSRPREDFPALDPEAIRRIVGDEVPIYFLPDGPVTRGLQEHLPQALRVFGGAARIWWPGASRESDGHDHPLIHDPHGTYGTRSLERFASRWA